ncbi:retinol dehydrogenase 7-like [Gastrophryne carolinensis]
MNRPQSQILEGLTDIFVFMTGCDSGFGNLLAKQLDQRGMKVLAACLTEKGAENLKKEASSRLQTIIHKGLWGLVNNAGIGLFVPDGWAKKEDFVKVLNVNLLGMVDVTLTLLPLIRRAQGRIVNVASAAGRLAILPGGYSVSKFTVEAFSDTLRRELLDFGVKVSIIEPGAFRTHMTNISLIRKNIEERWEALPAETKRIYGEQYLRKCITDIEHLASNASANLSEVTNCMEHGLTARYPWTRYSPGWDGKFFYVLYSYLPTFISAFQKNFPATSMWLLLLWLLALLLLYRWYRQSLILDNLTDKYVFITGCDTGFGNLLAKQLDKCGIRVLAACLTDVGAENLKDESSSRLQTVILDISDSQSVKSSGEWVSQVVGDKGLWGLVNNAGISGVIAPIGWLKKEDFLKTVNVNLLGMIDVTLTMLPHIRRARGRIVNVSSILGRIAMIPGGYTITKYGVEAFSDTLRRELGDFGVKVSIIEPGGFVTNIIHVSLLEELAKDRWEKLPSETKKSYGEQYLEKLIQQIHIVVSSSSSKIFRVTNCMEHALTARYPWTRYSAGWDAKLFFIPLSYLPTFIIDFIARKNAPKAAPSLKIKDLPCFKVIFQAKAFVIPLCQATFFSVLKMFSVFNIEE